MKKYTTEQILNFDNLEPDAAKAACVERRNLDYDIEELERIKYGSPIPKCRIESEGDFFRFTLEQHNGFTLSGSTECIERPDGGSRGLVATMEHGVASGLAEVIMSFTSTGLYAIQREWLHTVHAPNDIICAKVLGALLTETLSVRMMNGLRLAVNFNTGTLHVLDFELANTPEPLLTWNFPLETDHDLDYVKNVCWYIQKEAIDNWDWLENNHGALELHSPEEDEGY